MTFFGLSELESYSSPLTGAEAGLFEHIKSRIVLAEGLEMFGGGFILNEEYAIIHSALGGKVIDLLKSDGEVIHSIVIHSDEELGLSIVRFHKRPRPEKIYFNSAIPKNRICYLVSHEVHLNFMLSECEILEWSKWVKNHQIEPVYEEGIIGCPVYNASAQLMGITIGTEEDTIVCLDIMTIARYIQEVIK